MDPSSAFGRAVDESTSQYRNGLFLGMWDMASGEYEPHPYAFPSVQHMSPAELEGYHDALDDSDEPRDETAWPTFHFATASTDGIYPLCDSEDRVFLVASHIQHVDCPDCQEAHDVLRDYDDIPEPFDPEETIVP